MSDDEIDSFVKIEKQLALENSSSDMSSSHISNKDELNSFSITDSEILQNYQKLVEKIQKKARELKRGKKELKAEQKLFAREKAQFESDKILNGTNTENFTKLAVKYTQLQEKHKKLKDSWKEEKEKLENEIKEKDSKIETLEKRIKELEATTQNTGTHKNDKNDEENSDFYEEEINRKKNTIVLSPIRSNKKLSDNPEVFSPPKQSIDSPKKIITYSPARKSKQSSIINTSQTKEEKKSFVFSPKKESDSDESSEVRADLDYSSSSSINDPTGGVVIRSDNITQSPPKTPIKQLHYDVTRIQIILNKQYPLSFVPISTDIVEEKALKNRKKLIRFADGSSGTLFPNGSLKVIRGNNVFIYYDNGDISQQFPDGTIGYSYNQKGTIELNLTDGSVVYKFPNGQVEQHFKNGEKDIQYADGTFKHINSDGSQILYDNNGNALGVL